MSDRTVTVSFTACEARAVRRAAEFLQIASEGSPSAPVRWRATALRDAQMVLVSAMERAGIEHEASLEEMTR